MCALEHMWIKRVINKYYYYYYFKPCYCIQIFTHVYKQLQLLQVAVVRDFQFTSLHVKW